MNRNELTLLVYERNSNSTVVDPLNLLTRGQGLSFDTYFPGGVFGSADVFIPCDPTQPFPYRGGQRLLIRNGLTVVYEGDITQTPYVIGQGGVQGRRIVAGGAWEQRLGRWRWDKRWADTRLSADVWQYPTSAFSANDVTEQEIMEVRQEADRMRFTPKAEAFTANWYGRRVYTMPTGETVKRITLSYEMQEAAQAWALQCYDGAGNNQFDITASGTGTQDVTLGSPNQVIFIDFRSINAQTPTSDGVYFGQVDNAVSAGTAFVVYSETGNINGYEIARDIRAENTDLNSDESQISSALTLSLIPFMTNGAESHASILSRAVGYGDASFNSWYAQLLESDAATSPNGRPVLKVAQYPSLSDYDYGVRIDDLNLQGIEIAPNYDGIYNYISVRYRDAAGVERVVSPDDDANLTDATSVATYGRREPQQPLDIGLGTQALAVTVGRRYLAQAKDLRHYVSGPITVKEYIVGKNGERVPCSQIRAGKRIRVLNFLNDEIGVSNAGLTFIITHAQYRDDTREMSISTGVSDDLALYIARLQAGV